MIRDVVCFTIIVRDQDEALAFYTKTLGFEKRADNPMGEGRRWVSIAPPDAQVVFALQPLDWFQGEEREERLRRIGESPTIVLRVDNCRETYDILRKRDVKFTELPNDTPYGVQATFKDLYGNTLVLLQQPL